MRKQDYYEPSIGRESEPRRRPKKKKKRANRGERAVVQVDDVKLLVHVHLREHTEQAEACRVDENGNLRLLALQQGAVRGEACAILQVEREILRALFHHKRQSERVFRHAVLLRDKRARALPRR